MEQGRKDDEAGIHLRWAPGTGVLEALYRQLQEPGDEQRKGVGEEEQEPAQKVGVPAPQHVAE